MNNKAMNICFSVNDSYFEQLATVIVSVLENNKTQKIKFYVLTTDITTENKDKIEQLKNYYNHFEIEYVYVDLEKFENLKLNISHISKETYFRYIMAEVIKDSDRALYLDADLVVTGDLKSLYKTNLNGFYCAGVRDVSYEKLVLPCLEKFGFAKDNLYVNAGVLLFNLEQIREENMVEALFENTQKLFDQISFQDQDIINITFKDKIKEVEFFNNYKLAHYKKDKKSLDKAVAIHYVGPMKPWNHFKIKKNYRNELMPIWNKYNDLYLSLIGEKKRKKIKVGLIIDEFFGGAGTAFGGYGFLARKYISKYIPNEDIQVDVLLGKGKKYFSAQKFHEDNVDLYKLPRRKLFAKKWLKKQDYDVYLSIEMTHSYVLENEPDKNKKLIFWIQDPRPWGDWREIETVELFPEDSYYNPKIYNIVNEWYLKDKIKFISQGYFLNDKAKDLYRLKDNVDIQYLPNAIDFDKTFDVNSFEKKNNIIFLGRIESVKRGWLFCEIAKKMPEYNFYVLGQAFRDKEKNSSILDQYRNISNLHFAGHVDGEEKETFLKEAKVLVNTSIHEALPVSFIEALAYGTLLVSNRNPEDLTSKFGVYVGDVLGDGFDKVDLFVEGIRTLIENDAKRRDLAMKSIDYVREVHNIEKYVKDLRNVIFKEALR